MAISSLVPRAAGTGFQLDRIVVVESLVAATTTQLLAILDRLRQWVDNDRMDGRTTSLLDQMCPFLRTTRQSDSASLVATIEKMAERGENRVIVILESSAILLETRETLVRSMMVEAGATLDRRALRMNDLTETAMGNDVRMTIIEKARLQVDLGGRIKTGRAETRKMAAWLIDRKKVLPPHQQRKMHQRTKPNP